MALVAIGVALLYGSDERTFGGGVIGWGLAFIGGYAISGIAKQWFPKENSSVYTGLRLGTILVGGLVLNLAVFGNSRSAEPWVWVSIASILLLALAISGKHAELSANRMMIFAVVGGWLTIALSAAASRMNLLAAQIEESGLAGQYKDTQITSGYFVALLAMLVAFVGAVSLWANRRDVIINRLRAEKQREAAEASAAEIQAALELAQQHQREARAGN